MHLREFAEEAKQLLNAQRFYFNLVVYNDLKMFRTNTLKSIRLSRDGPPGNFDPNLIDDRVFDLLYDKSFLQRSAGCGAAKARHRDDRAASEQPKQVAHARSAKVKPLHATLARRALLRLDSMAAPDPHSLGVPRPQLPRLCPACLPRYPLQAILR
jgi:hypothetical protein